MKIFDDFDNKSYIVMPTAIQPVLEDQTRKALRKRKLNPEQKLAQRKLKAYWNWKSPFTLTERGLIIDKEYLESLNGFLCIYGTLEL